MLEYFNQNIKPLNDKLGKALGARRKIEVRHIPDYSRFWFVNQGDKQLIQVSDRVHKYNASFYRNKYRQYTTIKQPLTMIERLSNE